MDSDKYRPSPADMRLPTHDSDAPSTHDSAPGKDEKLPYYESSDINGTTVVCDWYDDQGRYEMYFPQIEVGHGADQMIPISSDAEAAKKVYAYAAELAKSEPDVYELRKKVSEFVSALPRETEEESEVTEAAPTKEAEIPYYESSDINGTTVVCDWYDDQGRYEMYFPQIEYGHGADQVIPISSDAKEAREVYKYAAAIAEIEPDVYKVYEKVLNFARKFHR